MQLYILRPIKDWEPWYDKAFCFVVRASSEQSARRIASAEHGDEGKEAWLDDGKTTCEVLTATGDEGVVCRDFARA